MQSLDERGSELSAAADGGGRWFDAEGKSLDFLTGCVTVDVMATPFTNTLAIRHLGLSVGESKEIDVVFVTIPELQLRRVAQRYTCLAREPKGSRYLYESLGSGFKAELSVDAEQLVVVYQGVWERPTTHGQMKTDL